MYSCSFGIVLELYFHYICRPSVSSLEEYFLQELDEQLGELKEWMVVTALFYLNYLAKLIIVIQAYT